MARINKDFYEIQSLQWKKSLFVFTALIYVAAAISSFVMRLLSTLISRERELLADAAAVEFGRDPSSPAAMAGKKPDRIIRDVWEGRQNRKPASIEDLFQRLIFRV